MQIKIKLFGKTKELMSTGDIIFNFDASISVAKLKTVLIEKFSESGDVEKVASLINDCALGNAQQVLRSDYLINDNESLVLLPPVCGG